MARTEPRTRECSDELADDESDLCDSHVTLCVHAGIAAADVICCARLGRHAHGENHDEAIGLIEKVDTPSTARPCACSSA